MLDPLLSPQETAQLVGRVARQGQRKACVVYHLAVYNSIEERLLRLRDRIARGNAEAAAEAALGGGGGGGGDARAKAAAAVARLKDANASLAERLSAADLLALLDGGVSVEGNAEEGNKA